MIASSLTTKISLLIAAMERPAPADKMPTFAGTEEPGRPSTIACALDLGSCEETLDWLRTVVRALATAGRVVRAGMDGRSRAAPRGC